MRCAEGRFERMGAYLSYVTDSSKCADKAGRKIKRFERKKYDR